MTKTPPSHLRFSTAASKPPAALSPLARPASPSKASAGTRPDHEPKWRTPEAAAYVGCSPRTLEKYRQIGAGPLYLKIGRTVLYRRSQLDAWLEECERRSTSDPGLRAEARQ